MQQEGIDIKSIGLITLAQAPYTFKFLWARLFQYAQQNLREMRAIQQQYLLEAWNEFSSQSDEMEYEVGDRVDAKAKKIEVPISLRDQILGQIVLESNEDWTPDQESLINAVATQAAIALENARLVGESRQVAMRERMLAEINSKIWSSTTVDCASNCR